MTIHTAEIPQATAKLTQSTTKSSLRIMPLLCTPVLLVLLLMFYWLVRVLFTQWRPQAYRYIAAKRAE